MGAKSRDKSVKSNLELLCLPFGLRLSSRNISLYFDLYGDLQSLRAYVVVYGFLFLVSFWFEYFPERTFDSQKALIVFSLLKKFS